MRKPVFAYSKKKATDQLGGKCAADQLRGNRTADQPLCFRYIVQFLNLIL